MRILVVRSHADTNQILSRLLTYHGHEVAVRTCLQEAREFLAAYPCDVILSGVGLPDGNAWDAVRELTSAAASQAERGGAVKAIALTGYGLDEDVERSLQSGFSGHVVMPATIEQILDAIRRVAAGELVRPPRQAMAPGAGEPREAAEPSDA